MVSKSSKAACSSAFSGLKETDAQPGSTQSQAAQIPTNLTRVTGWAGGPGGSQGRQLGLEQAAQPSSAQLLRQEALVA